MQKLLTPKKVLWHDQALAVHDVKRLHLMTKITWTRQVLSSSIEICVENVQIRCDELQLVAHCGTVTVSKLLKFCSCQSSRCFFLDYSFLANILYCIKS